LVAGSVPVLALAAPGLAQAASGHPHFINNATSASQSGSTLTVAFKEAGLPSGATETVTTSATASTTYECVNGGGKNPSASNKHSYTTTVAKSGTFTADRNGNIVGSETLSPPSAASVGFSCPSGQTVTFVGVSYTNVQITDTTSGASTNFGGAYSYTNPNAPAVR
jgi:hypothetical protein